MSVTYEVTGTITDAGVAAAIRAGSAGPQINVGGFRLGADSATEGAVALVSDTDVSSFVYADGTSSMTYTQVDQDTVVWRVRLDTTVGNFNVGNVGLVLQDGTLFCKAVMLGRQFKYQNALPGQVGNTIYLNVFMRLANVSTLLNLNLLDSTDCTLPEVATELVLPDASTSVFDVYLVDNHTHAGVPVTSARLNGKWRHAPHRAYPGQGQGVVVLSSSSFSATPIDGNAAAPTLGPVGYDAASQLFVAADGASESIFPVGIRTSTFEITTLGIIPASAAGLNGTLAPFAPYYAGTGGATGQLSTTPNGQCLAVVTPNGDLWVDTSKAFVEAVGGDVGDAGTNDTLADLLAIVSTLYRHQKVIDRHVRSLEERAYGMNQRLVANHL